MKLVTFEPLANDASAGSPRIGAVVEAPQQTSLIDLWESVRQCGQPPPDFFRSMQQFLSAGPPARAAAERVIAEHDPARRIPWDAVRIAAPLPRPASLRDCLSFERHWIQSARTIVGRKFPPLVWLDKAIGRVCGWSLLRPPRIWYQRPVYYKGNPRSVVGDQTQVRWPDYSRQLDFELELAAYVGQEGSNIDESTALRHIAGYSLFNDVSARDVQGGEIRSRMGPSKSKDFDTGNILGPWIATPEEIDIDDLSVTVRVNGEIWSQGSTRDMHHRFARMISFISNSETLYPGDVIGSGTVPGCCGLELNRWIQPGDVVELAAPGLGRLTNKIGEQLPEQVR
jgi:2-keto-4-pentenoate hydratase/2-oxohepta-3-ene-1,7-dioic acid hydratase in catechol pathway